MKKQYAVFQIVDTEDGFDTQRLAIHLYCESKQEALDYIKLGSKGRYYYTIMEVYQIARK